MTKNVIKIIGLVIVLLTSPVVLAEQYKIVGNFLNNGKIISKKTEHGNKFAVKDKQNKIRTNFDYDFIMPVAQTKYGILAGKQGKFGTLDPKTYQEKIPFVYDSLTLFDDELNIAVVVKNGRSGAINPDNKVIIPFDYRMLSFNFRKLEQFDDRVVIATPLDKTDFLIINANNQILGTIARFENLPNYFIQDFDNQFIALGDDKNNAVLVDWQGNIVLQNLRGKATITPLWVTLIDDDKKQIVTIHYTQDEHGKYQFAEQLISDF